MKKKSLRNLVALFLDVHSVHISSSQGFAFDHANKSHWLWLWTTETESLLESMLFWVSALKGALREHLICFSLWNSNTI